MISKNEKRHLAVPLFILKKIFYILFEFGIVINLYEIEIGVVYGAVISALAVVVTDEYDLIMRISVLLAVFVKRVALVIRSRRHVK